MDAWCEDMVACLEKMKAAINYIQPKLEGTIKHPDIRRLADTVPP